MQHMQKKMNGGTVAETPDLIRSRDKLSPENNNSNKY